jgi:phosphatidylserine synthase
MNKISPVVGFLAKGALLCSALLLLSNLQVTSTKAHAWLTSAPLALAGVAYAVLQIRLRPDRWTLVKRLFLSASFVFWAIDQFLPSGQLAMFVGDAVVSAYVLDLFWIIQEQRENHGGGRKIHAEIEQRATR